MGEHDRMDQKWYEALRCPERYSPRVWYPTLALGTLAACVAFGGLLGAVLSALNYFR